MRSPITAIIAIIVTLGDRPLKLCARSYPGFTHNGAGLKARYVRAIGPSLLLSPTPLRSHLVICARTARDNRGDNKGRSTRHAFCETVPYGQPARQTAPLWLMPPPRLFDLCKSTIARLCDFRNRTLSKVAVCQRRSWPRQPAWPRVLTDASISLSVRCTFLHTRELSVAKC